MADDNNSGMSAIVALVAIIIIALIGFFAIQMLRGEGGNTITPDVNVEAPLPDGE